MEEKAKTAELPYPAGPPVTPGEAKRVGNFAGTAGWVLGLVAGVIVAGLASSRSPVLLGLVGVPAVLVSYFLGTFAGGRIARDYFRVRNRSES